MPALIRAASLAGLAGLVRDLGGDPEPLLSRHGLDLRRLGDPEALIGHAEHDRVLDDAAEQLACPDLALRLASAQGPAMLGPLAVAVRAAPTGTDAFEIGATYLHLHSPAITIAVEPDPAGRRGVVALTYTNRMTAYSPQGIEHGLAVFYLVLRSLVGDEHHLRSVLVPHRPRGPIARHTAFFDADVRFGAPVAALCVQAELLGRALQGADAAVRATAIEHLEARYRERDLGIADQVRIAIRTSLVAQVPTVQGVADLFSVTSRTLQRRLENEGTSFAVLLDEVRRDLALHQLTATTAPMGHVSRSLGYADQTSFNHACRRWFDQSPRQVRHRP